MTKQFGLFLLLITSNLWANPEMEKANTLYFNEKYEEAITVYENIIKTKQESVALYFNLANAHYKLHHIAPAIYYYEKALLLDPNDKEVLNNLRFAQAMTIDEIKEVPKVGFVKILHDITSIFHYDVWAWITVSLSIATLLIFIAYFFSISSTSKRVFFISMFVVLVALAVSVTASLFEQDQYYIQQPAIVFSDVAPLKEEPKTDSDSIMTLHEGCKVFIKETYNNWSKIEIANGSEGWIASTKIKKIK